MSLIRIVLAAIVGLSLVGPGVAQSPATPPAGAKQEGMSPPRAGDAANRAGGTKRARPTQPSAIEEQTPPDADDARMNRILNGICRGC